MSDIAAQSNAVDIKLVIPIVGAAAAFVIWVIKEFWMAHMRKREAGSQHDNLVRALFAEIDFNTRDMQEFLKKSPSEELLRDAMTANPGLVPHITDARHTEIYRNRIDALHSVSDSTLAGIVHFYGMLEKVKVQIDGVNFPSYQTLSVDGRMNGVMVIVRTATMAERFGLELLAAMQSDYPSLDLTRFERGTDQTDPS